MTDKLKDALPPCPFCGGDAVVMDSGSGEYWAQCSRCWGTGGVECNIPQAVFSWNRRAPSAELDAALAAQEKGQPND